MSATVRTMGSYEGTVPSRKLCDIIEQGHDSLNGLLASAWNLWSGRNHYGNAELFRYVFPKVLAKGKALVLGTVDDGRHSER